MMLLSRGYKVSVYESREHPSNTTVGARAFSLGLNIRGQKALKYFQTRAPGLWEDIKRNGLGIDAFHIHIGSKELKIRKPKFPNTYDAVVTWEDTPPPTLMIPRNKLCESMLGNLEKHHKKSGNFRIKFSSKLDSVDLEHKVCRFECGESASYDLLVGADGVQSAVRKAMVKGDDSMISEEVILPGKYVVLNEDVKRDCLLQSGSVHAMENSNADYGLFVIPRIGGSCTLLTWKDDTPPNLIRNISANAFTGEDKSMLLDYAKVSLTKAYPKFGTPTNESLQQLFKQRPSEARTIRCNRYHSIEGCAVLVGDAAHSTGGTLGQGANSALLDVVELDKCLEETEDSLSKAISLYSKRQVPQGLALWSLLQIPNKLPFLFKMIYLLSQVIRGFISRFLKFISPPTQILLSQTLTPFTDIVHRNKFWVGIALRGIKNIEYES